jgi:hypothetical protein
MAEQLVKVVSLDHIMLQRRGPAGKSFNLTCQFLTWGGGHGLENFSRDL